MSYLCTESAEKGKPDMAEGERKILIKKIPKKFTHSVVRPSAMNQK